MVSLHDRITFASVHHVEANLLPQAVPVFQVRERWPATGRTGDVQEELSSGVPGMKLLPVLGYSGLLRKTPGGDDSSAVSTTYDRGR